MTRHGVNKSQLMGHKASILRGSLFLIELAIDKRHKAVEILKVLGRDILRLQVYAILFGQGHEDGRDTERVKLGKEKVGGSSCSKRLRISSFIID